MTDIKNHQNQSSDDEPKVVKKTRLFNGLTMAERKTLRKQQLLDAGIELYGTKGFFNVKIKDVCQQAKLTERYFYESFSSSEELFHTIFKQQVQKLHTAIFSVFFEPQSQSDPKAILQHAILQFLKTIKADQRMARILYVDAMLVPDPSMYSTVDVHREASQLIYKALKDLLLGDKKFTPLAKLMIDGGTGYCTRICLSWVNSQFTAPLEEVAALIQLFFEPVFDIMSDVTHPQHRFLVSAKEG